MELKSTIKVGACCALLSVSAQSVDDYSAVSGAYMNSDKFSEVHVASNLKPSVEKMLFLGLTKGSFDSYVTDVKPEKIGYIFNQEVVEKGDKADLDESLMERSARLLHYKAQKFCRGSDAYFLDNFDFSFASNAWSSRYSSSGGGQDSYVVSANALCFSD
ncbi:hypothetical protein [Vibrio crassostreae]|uniref:hypothetical protein n=1 Tax=Vibrio crassostreae TaxID=246167 RepID=UPI001B30FD10|nr:hypothetical protein [Vibrio crassostreae]